MATQHTPQADRTPPVNPTATPGPMIPHAPPAMMMTLDQFMVLLESHRTPSEPAEPAVNTVAVKLPNFWMSDPELWFMQAEAVFNTRSPKVTVDGTKFDHIMTALP